MKVLRALSILLLALVLLMGLTACGKTHKSTTTTAMEAPTTTTELVPSSTTTDPTDAGPTEPREKVITAVDVFSTFSPAGENDGWQYQIYSFGENRTGRQYVSFFAYPLADNSEGIIGFADADTEVAGIDDLAMLIRMNAEGFFDAKNGDNFEKIADATYESDGSYLVEVTADFNLKTYSVSVSPDGGGKTLIAENFAFTTNTEDSDDLGQVFFIAAGGSDQFSVDTMRRMEFYDPSKTYNSTGHNLGWPSKPIKLAKEYTGKIKIEYDTTALIPSVDGSVNFTDGDFDVLGFGDLSTLIRMKIDGAYFDARNGPNFERLAEVPVIKDKKYHVEVIIDIDAKIYSVWVTPTGEAKALLAESFSFRETAAHADSIGQCFVISAHENDSIIMENMVIVELND